MIILQSTKDAINANQRVFEALIISSSNWPLQSLCEHFMSAEV